MGKETTRFFLDAATTMAPSKSQLSHAAGDHSAEPTNCAVGGDLRASILRENQLMPPVPLLRTSRPAPFLGPLVPRSMGVLSLLALCLNLLMSQSWSGRRSKDLMGAEQSAAMDGNVLALAVFAYASPM